jgi:hypothetical protein
VSLLDSLADFVTGTYTVTRTVTGGYDVHGKNVAGSTSTLSVDASLQPLTGRDLMALPEGQRSQETQWFYAAVQMHGREPGFEPDKVTIDGEPWVITSVEKWVDGDDVWYRCKVSRRAAP